MSIALPTSEMLQTHVMQLRAYHVRIPLRTTIRHASHARTTSDNVIVECRLGDGTVGYGEGVPRDYVTGETIDQSLALLRETDWDRQLPPAGDFVAAVRIARDLQLPPVPGDARGCIGNAARCAAELAILDAYGKRFNQPLSRIASLPDFQEIYEPRDRCFYSGAITSASTRKEILTAIKVRIFGFRHCKIKVGTAGQDDVTRLGRFRRILSGRDFRIDANEAWTPDEAADRILELERFGISAVEQPVRHEEVACLADVRRRVNTPIMLDESLCSLADAEAAIQGEWCDLFNLRLSKCGGFVRSLELALLAHRAGLGCQLGCQVGETGILSAAGRHFACSVAGLRYCEGSYDRFLVRERLTKENLTFRWRGRASALARPGLGVTVDPESFKRVALKSHWLFGSPNGVGR
jgi:muconate cycloisomerase